MKRSGPLAAAMSAAVLSIGLAACSNMTPRERDTAVGAAVGGAAGAIIDNGGAAGTLGGAAVGGVIGNQVGKNREKK
ncbi:glycine zipper 2TM domain-containing protein [Uliginosibacterium sp. sgz301328]|uniref:glycine zipper 2TM domain-containing protein n=1 Tax=Uliginosibacterium sp. sgz301328 TaxID=3243764 RepID=UPI00359EDDE1